MEVSVRRYDGEVAVDAGAGDAEGFGDLGEAFSVGAPRGGGGEFVGVHDDWAAADAALRAGGSEAGHGAFAEHVSFELGEGSHHGEEELAFPAGGVGAGQSSGEDVQPDAALVQVCSSARLSSGLEQESKRCYGWLA